MPRLRISIAWLLGIVGMFALAFASVRLASDMWVVLVRGALFLLLSIAVLGSVFDRGLARAFWIGVALFGWSHMLAAHFKIQSPIGVTQSLAATVAPWVYPVVESPQPTSREGMVWNFDPVRKVFLAYTPAMQFGQTIMANWLRLLYSFLGGLIAVGFASRNRSFARTQTASSASSEG